VTRFRFVEAEAAQFPVSLLCRVVGVTRQGFCAWRRRPPSNRELADRELAVRIRQIYLDTDEIYGAPRIYSELKLGDGIAVGKKRVARLMRQLGLRGADGRRGGPRTTVRDPKRLSAPDLVDRDFARAQPNRLWVCDLKYIQTGQGFLFLAAVQDVFSRRIDARDQATVERLQAYSEEHGIWDCTRCYFCQERCPKGVDPLDAIAKLGAEAIKQGIDSDMGARHAKWFVTSAKTTGWLRETELVPKTQGV